MTEDGIRAATLEDMTLGDLRQVWRDRYGAVPKLRSTEFLRRLLAWRIQAEADGGLTEATLRSLVKASAVKSRPELRPGLKVAREWQGVRHEAEILEDGVSYQSEVYDSLSEVARTITGVRWNGPRFFGLRSGS